MKTTAMRTSHHQARRSAPSPADKGRAMWVPMATPNVCNGSHMHWSKVARMRRSQREAVSWRLESLWRERPSFPVVVTITRVSSGTLDPHDGLRSALKSCVDAIAKWLVVDDADERVRWEYGQEKGKPKMSGVVIEIARDTKGSR